MNYIELFKEQLNDNNIENKVYKSALFQEYFALNCFLNNFKRTNERLTELICEDISLLTNQNLSRIEKSIQIIKENVNILVEENNILFTDYFIDGIVLLLGDSTVDSQGIMIGDKSYMVIDLLAYSAALENYNPVSFLVHEITHPIHYKLNPDMYFRNFSNQGERVIKRLIVEGLATYTARVLTNETDEDVFWLGFLDKQGVSNWKAHSSKVIENYSKPMNDLIANGYWNDNYQFEFFSIINPEKLWEGRLAYYYGFEIVSNIVKEKTVDEILKLSYSKYYDEIKRYFSLNNII